MLASLSESDRAMHRRESSLDKCWGELEHESQTTYRLSTVVRGQFVLDRSLGPTFRI